MNTCPFCYTEVHQKAEICRGCGAEKTLGTSRLWTDRIVTIASLIVGLVCYSYFVNHTENSYGVLVIISALLILAAPLMFIVGLFSLIFGKYNDIWTRKKD
jgi:hypothetical protein